MTNQQLYLAIGVPVLIYLFGFTSTFLIVFWQGKEIRDDIKAMRAEFRTAIDMLIGKVNDIDTRVAVLEDRAKGGRT